MQTMSYTAADRVARITLDRPQRGNGLTRRLIDELAACVEQADLDPAVHVILLAGNGKGFCGGYALVASSHGLPGAGADLGCSAGGRARAEGPGVAAGSPLDPAVQAANHAPDAAWDPMVDYAM